MFLVRILSKTLIVPDLGFNKPTNSLNRVVLPEPLFPVKAHIIFFSNLNEIFRKAKPESYSKLRLLTSNVKIKQPPLHILTVN